MAESRTTTGDLLRLRPLHARLFPVATDPVEEKRLKAEHRRAQDAAARILFSQFGLQKSLSRVVADALADPVPLVQGLEAGAGIKEEATDYGVAQFIEALVYPVAILPFQNNPREFETRPVAYAISGGRRLSVGRPKLSADRPGKPLLRIGFSDESQLVRSIRETYDYMASDQGAANLRDQIRPAGVKRPLTLTLCRIRYGNGASDRFCLSSLDGSTRAVLCHRELGVTPPDLVEHFLHRTASREQLLGSVARLELKPLDDLSPEDVFRHRALAVPARILVGVRPHRLNDGLPDVLKVVIDLLDTEHGVASREWPKGGKREQLNRKAIARVLQDGILESEEEARYLLGDMPRDEIRRHLGRFPESEHERAIYIAHKIFDASALDAISTVYRALHDDKNRLGPSTRAQIAADLGLAAYVSDLPAEQIPAVRSILERTWNWTEFRNRLGPPSGLNPNELLIKAIDELRTHPDEYGRYRLELGMAGAYYLIRWRALRRDTRDTDNRGGTQVVEAMLSSEHGLRQLHRAIVDGVENEPPKAVAQDGQVRTTGAGEPVLLDHQGLRAGFNLAYGLTAADRLKALWTDMSASVDSLEERTASVLNARAEVSLREAVELARLQAGPVEEYARRLEAIATRLRDLSRELMVEELLMRREAA